MFYIFFYFIYLLMVTALSMEAPKDVCLTTGCVEASLSISKLMDQTINPCVDFYSFACGNFVNETIIPDEKSSVDTFSIILDKVQEQLRTLVSIPVNDSEIYPFKLVKKLYKSCMNTSMFSYTFSPCFLIIVFKGLIQDRGIKPLVDILDTLGGWPVVKGDLWNESSWTWQNSSLISSKIGYATDYIFKLTIAADRLNNTIRIIYVRKNNI